MIENHLACLQKQPLMKSIWPAVGSSVCLSCNIVTFAWMSSKPYVGSTSTIWYICTHCEDLLNEVVFGDLDLWPWLLDNLAMLALIVSCWMSAIHTAQGYHKKSSFWLLRVRTLAATLYGWLILKKVMFNNSALFVLNLFIINMHTFTLVMLECQRNISFL